MKSTFRVSTKTTELSIESLERRRLLTLNDPVVLLPPEYPYSSGFESPSWVVHSEEYHYWRDFKSDKLWRTDGTAEGTKEYSLDGAYSSSHGTVRDGEIVIAVTKQVDLAFRDHRSASPTLKSTFSSAPFVAIYQPDTAPISPSVPPDKWSLIRIEDDDSIVELATIQNEPKVANDHFFYVESVLRDGGLVDDLWMYDTTLDEERLVAQDVDSDSSIVAIGSNYFYERNNAWFATNLVNHWSSDLLNQALSYQSTQEGIHYVDGDRNGWYFSDGGNGDEIRLLDIPNASAHAIEKSRGPNTTATLTIDGPDLSGIWISDGTVGGTKLIHKNASLRRSKHADESLIYGGETLIHVDLASGHATEIDGFNESDYDRVYSWFGRLFAAKSFVANDGTENTQQDFYDANGKSTVIVPEPNATTLRFAPKEVIAQQLTLSEKQLLFFANDGSSGVELWSSDGAEESAAMVVDLNTGLHWPRIAWEEVGDAGLVITYENASQQRKLTIDGDNVTEYHGEHRLASTGRVVSFTVNGVFDAVGNRLIDETLDPISFELVNGRMLIVVGRPNRQRELWSTDGTAQGTMRLSNSVGLLWTNFESELAFYEAGRSVLRTDGTVEGTELLVGSSSRRSSHAGTAIAVGGRIHLMGPAGYRELELEGIVRGFAGDKLWVSGPTGNVLTDGVETVSLPSFDDMQIAQFFGPTSTSLFNADGYIWRSDGTADGTYRLEAGKFVLAIGIPGTNRFLLDIARSNSIFVFYVSDGTAENTGFLSAELPGFEPNVEFLDGHVLLHNHTGLWGTDGTHANTAKLIDTEGEFSFVETQDTDEFAQFAFFTFKPSGANSRNLWVTDGTQNGTRELIHDFQGASVIRDDHLYTFNNDEIHRRLLSRWHNYGSPYDTTGDGQIAPRDALVVINELINREHSNRETSRFESAQTEFFYDVSQDGYLSPIDALRVINELNRRTNQPENQQSDGPFFITYVAAAIPSVRADLRREIAAWSSLDELGRFDSSSESMAAHNISPRVIPQASPRPDWHRFTT